MSRHSNNVCLWLFALLERLVTFLLNVGTMMSCHAVRKATADEKDGDIVE